MIPRVYFSAFTDPPESETFRALTLPYPPPSFQDSFLVPWEVLVSTTTPMDSPSVPCFYVSIPTQALRRHPLREVSFLLSPPPLPLPPFFYPGLRQSSVLFLGLPQSTLNRVLFFFFSLSEPFPALVSQLKAAPSLSLRGFLLSASLIVKVC